MIVKLVRTKVTKEDCEDEGLVLTQMHTLGKVVAPDGAPTLGDAVAANDDDKHNYCFIIPLVQHDNQQGFQINLKAVMAVASMCGCQLVRKIEKPKEVKPNDPKGGRAIQ